MPGGITDNHRKLALYLAALGSENLHARLKDTSNDTELLAAWEPLGITADMIAYARQRLEKTQKAVDAGDPDPCPYPPCPSYVADVLAAVAPSA